MKVTYPKVLKVNTAFRGGKSDAAHRWRAKKVFFGRFFVDFCKIIDVVRRKLCFLSV